MSEPEDTLADLAAQDLERLRERFVEMADLAAEYHEVLKERFPEGPAFQLVLDWHRVEWLEWHR